ncbi:sulfite exporter TauE/SafE family protein [Gloeomargaritales cyanobacterium VI4D9]|nr:sulfite exporter TauE/SafE family protein [Gloeomargaritales cyanobacterium VI4D9]
MAGFANLAGYLGRVDLDWHLTVNFTFLAGIGTVIGAYLVQYIHPKHLQKGFGYFLLGIAVLVLWQNQKLQKPRTDSKTHAVAIAILLD